MFQTYGYWALVEILQTSCNKIAHSEAAVKAFHEKMPDSMFLNFGNRIFLRKSDAAQEPHQGVPAEGSLADATSATSGITIAKRTIDVKAFGQ